MSSDSRSNKRKARTCRSTSSPSYPALSSAKTVADIDHLLIQILSFLPIKALMRFKCVSKRWLSLIANPEFHSIIRSRPPTISGLFLNYRGVGGIQYEYLSLDDDDSARRSAEAGPFQFRLRFANHPCDMTIAQSCNGLMLCRCSPRDDHEPHYHVYNPTTGQNALLPPLNGLPSHVFGFSLAYHPAISPHYKVVCLRTCDLLSDLWQIEIYSSETGVWRNSGSPFTLLSITEIMYTAFLNCTLYWLDYFGTCISFDIKQEKIKILPLPCSDADEADEAPDLGAARCFNESRGHLYSVQVNDLESSQFSVYEMEIKGSGWSPRYSVDLEHVAAAFPEMTRVESYTDRRIFWFYIVCVVREETDEDSYIILHIPDKVIRYNLKDRTFKKLRDFQPSDKHDQDSEFYGCRGSVQFIPSLARV